jgi:cell division septation protein DedD
MDSALKQRLVGAGVLVALAVIFLPMLVQGPAPDSGVADVPLAVPEAPQAGFETRDLPLVAPEATPEGGALGMEPAAQPSQVLPQPAVQEPEALPEPEPETEPAQEPAQPAVPAPRSVSSPEPRASPVGGATMYPAATAAGDYAVSFGSFSTIAAADSVVASLRAMHLPGYREAAQVDGKTLQRVRIGPLATHAEAEAARQRAAQAGNATGSRVIALDADEAPATAPKASATRASATNPEAPAAADDGFAVQVGAFSKSADAIELRDRARAAGFSAFVQTVATDKGNLTRVRIGPVASRAEAERLRAQVQAKLGLSGVVRSHP